VEWALLAGVPADDVRHVISIARRRTFARGEVVFHEGDPAEAMHLIVKGRFAVRVTTPLGDTVLLSLKGPGDCFGELALLETKSTRSATVAALEPGETLSVTRDDFARLLGQNPGVSRVLLALLAEQLRRTNERLVEAHYIDADTRVRRRLRELAELYGDGTIPLTQEEIAEIAGTSRATVNRVLREEEKKGTLELARGRTIVRDLDALRTR
jgi:CRP/FNR family cyclic AMP-dependent transcriptional regulator